MKERQTVDEWHAMVARSTKLVRNGTLLHYYYYYFRYLYYEFQFQYIHMNINNMTFAIVATLPFMSSSLIQCFQNIQSLV